MTKCKAIFDGDDTMHYQTIIGDDQAAIENKSFCVQVRPEGEKMLLYVGACTFGDGPARHYRETLINKEDMVEFATAILAMCGEKTPDSERYEYIKTIRTYVTDKEEHE